MKLQEYYNIIIFLTFSKKYLFGYLVSIPSQKSVISVDRLICHLQCVSHIILYLKHTFKHLNSNKNCANWNLSPNVLYKRGIHTVEILVTNITSQDIFF